MKIFGKNSENVNIIVTFENFEKRTHDRKFDTASQRIVSINGKIKCDIITSGFGLIDVFVKNTFGQLIERVVNRICERDEKVSQSRK